MVKAIWEGTVLAETEDIVVLEGNSYFPANAIHQEYFMPSRHTTFCPWKGTANYYDVEVNGKKNPAAAWYYPEPSPAANEIRGRVAFWRGVEVE
jgi:uncharacterized protein (DUF427 family)